MKRFGLVWLGVVVCLIAAPRPAAGQTNPADQTSAEGAVVSLQVVASDPDGDELTYTATGLPPGLSLDAATGIISGTLSVAGTYKVTVTVRDAAGGAVSTAFTWTIADTNRPPVIITQLPILSEPRDRTGAAAEVVSLEPLTTPGGITVRAVRLVEPLKLDGRLDESFYATVPSMSDFIQQEPQQGAPATEKTEVWVFFDDRNIYVSGRPRWSGCRFHPAAARLKSSPMRSRACGPT